MFEGFDLRVRPGVIEALLRVSGIMCICCHLLPRFESLRLLVTFIFALWNTSIVCFPHLLSAGNCFKRALVRRTVWKVKPVHQIR